MKQLLTVFGQELLGDGDNSSIVVCCGNGVKKKSCGSGGSGDKTCS